MTPASRRAVLLLVLLGVAAAAVLVATRTSWVFEGGGWDDDTRPVEPPGKDDSAAGVPPRLLAGGARAAPATDAAPRTVPLVEGASRIAFDVTVTTPAGERRDGFRVTAEMTPSDAPALALGEAVTDAAGRCRIGPLPTPAVARSAVPGAVVSRRVYGPYANGVRGAGPPVRVRAAGRDDVRVEDVFVLGAEFGPEAEGSPAAMLLGKAADVDGIRVVALTLAGTTSPFLRGRVVDTKGRPMASAHVRLRQHEPYWSGWTDENGRFGGDVAHAGKWAVEVSFPWFDRSPDLVLSREIDVVAGPAATSVELVVESEPSIEGRVVSADGAPLAGVPLALVGTGTSVYDAHVSRMLSSYSETPDYCIRVKSGEDGAFRFDALPKDERFDVRWWDDTRHERVGPSKLAPDAKGVVVRVEARHGVRVRCVDADTRATVSASIDLESISDREPEDESFRLMDPGEGERAFRAKPGERVRIVVQAERYDPVVSEHVVEASDGLDDVVVALHGTRSRARVRLRLVDENGTPWKTTPPLWWEFADSEARADPSPAPSDSRAFETSDLGPGRYRVRTGYDTVGLPGRGEHRFALDVAALVTVPRDGEVSVDLVAPRGGALRIDLRDADGKPLSPGDMTSLSVRDAAGASTLLRIFHWTHGVEHEGVGDAVVHETQALAPGIYTVEWTGGSHRGSPVKATAVARVLSGQVTDVEIVLR